MLSTQSRELNFNHVLSLCLVLRLFLKIYFKWALYLHRCATAGLAKYGTLAHNLILQASPNFLFTLSIVSTPATNAYFSFQYCNLRCFKNPFFRRIYPFPNRNFSVRSSITCMQFFCLFCTSLTFFTFKSSDSKKSLSIFVFFSCSCISSSHVNLTPLFTPYALRTCCCAPSVHLLKRK